MRTNARAELRTALRQLETQAQAARKDADEPCSRREAAKQAGLSGQRISDWLNDDPAKAPAPQDWDRVWALIRTWCTWAGRVPEKEKTYWDRLWQAATLETPAGVPAPQQVDVSAPGVTRREAGGVSLTDEQARAVEYLAGETLRYWQDQAKDRRITTPSPAAVRWRWAGHDVAVPAGEMGSQVLTTGVLTQLREQLYERLKEQDEQARVVILGGPGAGKTAAMLLLLIDILKHRPPGSDQPVPVWLTLGGWNPQTTTLRQYAAATLLRDYPGLSAAAHGGPDTTEQLIRTGRIALFLDGLDEIPPAVQGQALQAIDRDGLGLPLVLTSRPVEYQTALERGRLWGTAVIDLLPVDLEHAETFLLAEQLDNQQRAWQHVIDHMRAHPDSVPARTLTSPLALSLARDTCARTDPAELLDLRVYPTSEALMQHLLARSLHLAYPYPAERQHTIRWLAWIAQHMGTGRDLRWWDIPTWLPRWHCQLVIGLVIGLVVGLTAVLAVGLTFGLMVGLTVGLTVGLMVGLTAVLPGGLGGRRKPQPQAIAIRRLDHREIRELIGFMLMGAFVGLIALVGVLVIGAIGGLVIRRTSRPVGFMWLVSVLMLIAPVGLVGGLVLGFVGLWSRPLANAPAVSPIEVYRSDRQRMLVVGLAAGLMFGLVFGLVFGLAFGLVFGLAFGLGFGLAFGLAFGLGFSKESAAAAELIAAETIWNLRGQRVRFLPLLQTALDRQVLRQVGALYQFRHAALQDLLTNSYPDEAATRSLYHLPSVPESIVSGTPDDVEQTRRSGRPEN